MDIKNNRIILVTPALISFLIAFILLFKFSYPISWDVYYHIHMANLYLDNGLVFWDYQTVAPTGRLIMYPPLFHLILAFFSKILSIDTFNIAWMAQPIFAFILIFTITFVSYRLSGEDTTVGVSAGVMSLMSFSTFNRAVICTPATVAIASSMLSLLFYYELFEKYNRRKLIYSAVFLALTANLHMATFIITMGVIGLYSLYLILNGRINWKYLICYMSISLVLSSPWWLYIFLNYTMVFNSIAGSYLRIDEFLIKYYGIIPSLFTLIGFYDLYKNKSSKSVFLIIWSLSIVILSQVPLLGFDTVSIRIFEVSSYPLIIIAGIGLMRVLKSIKTYNLKVLVIILLIIYSAGACTSYTDSYTPDLLDEDDYNDTLFSDEFHLIFDPIGSLIKPSIISDRYGSSQLAHSRQDIKEYMIKNNITGLVVSEDAIMDTIIVSSSNASVVYGGFTESIPEYVVDPVHIINNHATVNELDSLGVTYLLIKKNTPTADYAKVEYENDDYKLCKITRIR